MDTLLNWLQAQDFSEILEENNLSEEEVLYLLYCHGHLELPAWLEEIRIDDNE